MRLRKSLVVGSPFWWRLELRAFVKLLLGQDLVLDVGVTVSGFYLRRQLGFGVSVGFGFLSDCRHLPFHFRQYCFNRSNRGHCPTELWFAWLSLGTFVCIRYRYWSLNVSILKIIILKIGSLLNPKFPNWARRISPFSSRAQYSAFTFNDC